MFIQVNFEDISTLVQEDVFTNRHYVPFVIYYIRHYFQSTYFPIRRLLYSTLHISRRRFLPFDIMSYSAFFLPSFLCPLVVIYYSTFGPFDVFSVVVLSHSTFSPQTFFTVGVFYFILSVNQNMRTVYEVNVILFDFTVHGSNRYQLVTRGYEHKHGHGLEHEHGLCP